jgi:beta-barrel assembly-enhancing protease
VGPFGYQPGYSRRGGCGSRFMLAILIAIAGFVMYWTNTEINPVTGVKQHVSMTPEEEIHLGLESAPMMAKQMGGTIPSTDARARVVQKVGQKVIQNSIANKGPWKFQFHLLKDPKTINAFALPGGQIFITLGLFNKLSTEAQLAGVLGHEAGHVIQRHAAQQMSKSQLGQFLVLATGVGADERGQQAAMLASLVNQMIQLRYGRQDELEADSWGLDLMKSAGYTPKAMVEVMKILAEAGGSGRSPEMLQSHPYPEKRIEQINAYLEKNPPDRSLTEGQNLQDMVRQEERR